MVWRDGERARELRANFRCPWTRHPVRVPPIVRMQIEQGFGGKRREIGIPRIGPGQRAHAFGVGILVGRPRRIRGRMAHGQRVDERTGAARSVRRQRLRLDQRRTHAFGGARVHVRVDVGTERPGETPPAERAARIGADRRFERARGFGGVEAPGQRHALMEIPLCGGHPTRHRPVVPAHAVEKRRDGITGGSGGAGVQRDAQDKQCGTQTPSRRARDAVPSTREFGLDQQTHPPGAHAPPCVTQVTVSRCPMDEPSPEDVVAEPCAAPAARRSALNRNHRI